MWLLDAPRLCAECSQSIREELAQVTAHRDESQRQFELDNLAWIEAVTRADALGVPKAEIARSVGVTRQWVDQICKKAIHTADQSKIKSLFIRARKVS